MITKDKILEIFKELNEELSKTMSLVRYVLSVVLLCHWRSMLGFQRMMSMRYSTPKWMCR